MSFIQQFFTSRDNNANAETFVGQQGRLWWDPNTNQIYSSDGVTPGGIPLAGGGGGNGSPGGSNSQVQFNSNGTFGGSANLTFNRTTGALTAVSFVGDGGALSNIAGANVTGTVSDANHATVADSANSVSGSNVVGEVANAAYATTAGTATSAVSATTAGTVTTNAQPNITSVGTLTALSVTGNISGNYFIGNGSLLTGISTNTYSNANVAAYLPTYTGNLAALAGNVTTTANVSALNFIGNGSTLTNITGANITGTVANATFATSAGSATTAITAGTVTTAAQPNITSVGTLTSVTVTGNVSGGNIVTGGLISAAGNASVANLNLTGNIVDTGALTISTGSNGNIALAPNGTGIVTASSAVSAAGNITGGNLITGGLISATSSVNSLNLVTRNGDANPVNSRTQIAMGFNGTTDYPQFVHTRHNAGNILFNTIEFWTSDGTQAGTFPANAVLGLTVMAGRVSVGNSIINPGNTLDVGGNVFATGNITAANVIVNTRLFVANGTLTQPSIAFSGDTGADSGFFLIADGNIGITTNAGTRAIVSDTGLSVIGNVTGGNLNTSATVSGGTINATTLISSAGNVIAGNVNTGGLITATGNITGGNINTAGRVSATGNINAGNLITTGAVYSNYNANTANTGSFMATGGNTKGGTGYLDFLVVQNTSGGATVPYKWLRTTSDGQFQIINSAYTQNIFNLTDAGNVAIPGQLFINGAQTTNGPAFSAYAAAILQTIPNDTQTKVLFQTEEYDTNNCYANSRFTPNVAGYYQLNAEVRLDGASGTGEMMIILYKNGAEYKRGTNQRGTQIAANFWAMQVSSVAYANGTGDYFEIYVQQGSGGSVTVTAVNNTAITWFNGCMLRGA